MSIKANGTLALYTGSFSNNLHSIPSSAVGCKTGTSWFHGRYIINTSVNGNYLAIS